MRRDGVVAALKENRRKTYNYIIRCCCDREWELDLDRVVFVVGAADARSVAVRTVVMFTQMTRRYAGCTAARLCARSKSRMNAWRVYAVCEHIRNAGNYTFSFTFCLSFSLHFAFLNSPFFSSTRSCVRAFDAELSVSFIPHAFRDVRLCYGLV